MQYDAECFACTCRRCCCLYFGIIHYFFIRHRFLFLLLFCFFFKYILLLCVISALIIVTLVLILGIDLQHSSSSSTCDARVVLLITLHMRHSYSLFSLAMPNRIHCEPKIILILSNGTQRTQDDSLLRF